MHQLHQKAAAITCSLLTILAAPLSASAADTESTVASARVGLAGIDLTRRDGADRLYAQIRSAARQVCEPVAANAAYRFAQLEQTRCVDKAIADAVAQINSSLLSAVHRNEPSQVLRIAQK